MRMPGLCLFLRAAFSELVSLIRPALHPLIKITILIFYPFAFLTIYIHVIVPAKMAVMSARRWIDSRSTSSINAGTGWTLDVVQWINYLINRHLIAKCICHMTITSHTIHVSYRSLDAAHACTVQYTTRRAYICIYAILRSALQETCTAWIRCRRSEAHSCASPIQVHANSSFWHEIGKTKRQPSTVFRST